VGSRAAAASTTNEVSALVRQELVEHLQGALVLWRRARFDLDLPVPLAQSGTSTAVGDQVFGAPGGAGIGDLRLGASVRLFGRAGARITGAAGAQLFLPTGDRKAFSSDGNLRFWPQVMVAGSYDRLTWGARLGVREMVCRIEDAVIDWLASHDIAGYGKRDAPGIYVLENGVEAKIGSLGLKVRNGCTYHGVAVNVAMDLCPFADIDPCGYPGLRVTQLASLGVSRTVTQAGDELASRLETHLYSTRTVVQ